MKSRLLPLAAWLAAGLPWPAMAASTDTVAPVQGEYFFQGTRCNNNPWVSDLGSAIEMALAEYYHSTSAVCSHQLSSETDWATAASPHALGCGGSSNLMPRFFFNSDIETHNSKGQTYTFWSYPHTGCTEVGNDGIYLYRSRDVYCPKSYGWDSAQQVCAFQGPLEPDKNNDECEAGKNGSNPVHTALGSKLQHEVDIDIAGSALRFERYYSSVDHWSRGTLGKQWRHGFERAVSFSDTGTVATAHVSRPNGNVYRFNQQSDGSFASDADVRERLRMLVNNKGVMTGWTLAAIDDSVERYDANGRLLSIGWPDGRSLSFSFTANKLTRVTDERGRYLELEYYTNYPETGIRNLVSQVRGPDGRSVSFTYEAAGSEQVIATRNDSASGERQYIYGEGGVAPRLLTGIVDENGSRYASWRYDSQQRAILSVHGDASSYVDRVELSYNGDINQDPTATTTVKQWIDGDTGVFNQRTYAFTLLHGVVKLASVTQPCTSCGGNTRSITYDANGYADRRTDFNGVVTDTDFSAADAQGARGLETRRIEAVSRDAQTNLPERRTEDTLWHDDFRQPRQRTLYNHLGAAEALERWAYNARGQVVAHCRIDPADTAAVAYECSATVAPPVAAKVQRTVHTYCEAADVAAPGSTCPILGYPKSVNGPRATTDAGMAGFDDTAVFSYYASTDESGCDSNGPCHRKGDLQTTTNGLGQVGSIVRYDRAGRPLLSRDANNVATSYAYDGRGQLVARTVHVKSSGVPWTGDASIHLSYDAVGNLTQIREQDGLTLDYTYDAARRLTSIADGAGNRAVYTLNSAGNRIKEEVFDANSAAPGTARSTVGGAHNQLGRLTKILNADAAALRDSTAFNSAQLADGYDGNGNQIMFADAFGVATRQEYDALNRLVRSVRDFHLGINSATRDTESLFSYDTRNNVTAVTDPAGLRTSHTFDGLNNLVAVDSPDTGHSAFTYDAAGNRRSQTDNRGITASYTYDALGRMTQVSYPGGDQDAAFLYDQSNSVTGCALSFPLGRLTRMTDPTGSTTYCYDRRGNVIRKTQVTEGTTLTVEYAYTLSGRLYSLTYPDGSTLRYSHDEVGRVNRVEWKANASASPVVLVDDVSYYPFGPLHVLSFGNGRSLTKTYDANYMIDSIASSAADGLKLDFSIDVLGNVAAVSDSIGATVPTRKYIYDRLYRLGRVDSGADAMLESYSYDNTGNRLTKQRAGQASETYSYLAGTHRLAAVAGVARSYDANGNMTARGDGFGFIYGPRNRLDGVSMPKGSGGGSVDAEDEDTGGKAAGLKSAVADLTYGYNGRGERVSKNLDPMIPSIKHIFGEKGLLLFEQGVGANSTRYVYVDDLPVAQIQGSRISYLETDHLGTPRVAADPSDNSVQWQWNFFTTAFGEHPATTSGTSGITVPLRYPGQFFDAETGLHYNYYRDYEPSTGRYIESDPIGLTGGMSTYAYADADPLTFVDPQGLRTITIVPPRPNRNFNYPPPINPTLCLGDAKCRPLPDEMICVKWSCCKPSSLLGPGSPGPADECRRPLCDIVTQFANAPGQWSVPSNCKCIQWGTKEPPPKPPSIPTEACTALKSPVAQALCLASKIPGAGQPQ